MHLENDLSVIRSALKDEKEAKNLCNKHLVQEKNKNEELRKSVESHQQRIEIITSETGANISQSKLRKALTDLVKENEGLKRDAATKDKEMQKLVDTIYKLKWKLNRAERRIDKLNHREHVHNNLDDEEDDLFTSPRKNKNVNGPSSFLKGNYIPKNVEFRLDNLEEEYYSKTGFVIQVKDIY